MTPHARRSGADPDDWASYLHDPDTLEDAVAVASAPERWIWTLVDVDARAMQALPGLHAVNRQGHFICDVAWPDGSGPVEW